MANLNIAILIAAKDQASGPIGRIRGALRGLGDTAQRGFSGLQRVAVVAGGAAFAGVAALGAGLGAVAVSGLSMNRQMEDVTARLNAFTKDGEQSAAILEMIRQRAAATPFAFNEMADAAAGLLPAATQSGVALEELISQAEILAASNPAEGLSGAAFALREAVSGDFTSIIERFNLPRTYINQLRDEGVPALEIVQRAMQQVGYDADLVANLAQTAGGRWSTFTDTLQNMAATVTQPLFDTFSGGLASVNGWLSANEPLITGLATTIAGNLAAGLETVTGFISTFVEKLAAGEGPLAALQAALTTAFGEGAATRVMDVVTGVQAFLGEVETAIAPITEFIAEFVTWQDVLTALAIVIGVTVVSALASVVIAAAPVIAVGAALVAAVALLRNAWETDFGGIRDFAAGVWEAIKLAWEAFRSLFSGDFDGFLSRISQAWETGWNAVVTFLGNLWAMVQPKLAEWFAAVRNWFVTTDWKALAQQVLDFIVDKLGQFWTYAQPKIQTWWESIRDWFESIDWKQLAFDVVTKLLTELSEFWTRAQGTFASWWESIKTWFAGVDWAALGRNITSGIVAGLQAGAQAIYDFIMQIAQGAWDAITDFFDMDSPSKLVTRAFRDDVAGAAAIGLQQGTPRVAAAATQLATGAAGPMLAGPQATGTRLTGAGGQPITIYGGLHLHGVSDRQSLLAELSALGA